MLVQVSLPGAFFYSIRYRLDIMRQGFYNCKNSEMKTQKTSQLLGAIHIYVFVLDYIL